MNEIEQAIDELKQQLHNSEDCLINGTTCEIAIEALEEKKNNRWITVSERLPEKTMQCLVTLIDMSNKTWVCERRFIEENQRFYTSGKVTAWRPLPEPYKEGYSDK